MTTHRRVKDPDIRGVGPALLRAALAARRITAATNTPLVIVENGKIVEKWVSPPNPARDETLEKKT
jgi:hypothetical protein